MSLSSLSSPPAALNLQRYLSQTSAQSLKAMEKLGSGQRINRASDDAAGLTISEKLRAQVSGLAMANRNIQDGISLINTADGALEETHSLLQRMRELAVQNANGTMSRADRNASNKEFLELKTEINNIANNTKFNGQKLLAANTNITLQIGADRRQTQRVALKRMTTAGLGISSSTVNISTSTRASTAIQSLDTAIGRVSSFRSSLGATSNGLEHAMNRTAVTQENLATAESRIRNADMADEVATLTRSTILQQSGTALLAQANSIPHSLITLLAPSMPQ